MCCVCRGVIWCRRQGVIDNGAAFAIKRAVFAFKGNETEGGQVEWERLKKEREEESSKGEKKSKEDVKRDRCWIKAERNDDTAVFCKWYCSIFCVLFASDLWSEPVLVCGCKFKCETHFYASAFCLFVTLWINGFSSLSLIYFPSFHVNRLLWTSRDLIPLWSVSPCSHMGSVPSQQFF